MSQIKPGKYCPLIKKDCIGLKCSWYTQIRGTNPAQITQLNTLKSGNDQ